MICSLSNSGRAARGPRGSGGDGGGSALGELLAQCRRPRRIALRRLPIGVAAEPGEPFEGGDPAGRIAASLVRGQRLTVGFARGRAVREHCLHVAEAERGVALADWLDELLVDRQRLLVARASVVRLVLLSVECRQS